MAYCLPGSFTSIASFYLQAITGSDAGSMHLNVTIDHTVFLTGDTHLIVLVRVNLPVTEVAICTVLSIQTVMLSPLRLL